MSARSAALGFSVVALLAAGLSARPALAQDHDEIESAYRGLAQSVVRVEARYASIFAPPGAGSGVVISDDGLIATADHVIDGAAEIWVVNCGDVSQRAEIIGRARERDLALTRIEADGLVPIEPQDRPVRPVQCVLALGNVMNWGIGVFAGIVSLASCTEGCAADMAAASSPTSRARPAFPVARWSHATTAPWSESSASASWR